MNHGMETQIMDGWKWNNEAQMEWNKEVLAMSDMCLAYSPVRDDVAH